MDHAKEEDLNGQENFIIIRLFISWMITIIKIIGGGIIKVTIVVAAFVILSKINRLQNKIIVVAAN